MFAWSAALLALAPVLPHQAVVPIHTLDDWAVQRAPSAVEPKFGPGIFSSASLPKWQEMISRHHSQLSEDRETWDRIVSELRSMEHRSLVQAVNEKVNEAVYVSDQNSWGVADHWGTPLELFSRGGDCEDFAIAKYLLLRELGVSAAQMQIGVTKDHAVLIVHTSEGPVVLDNQRAAIRPAKAHLAKRIVFTVNEVKWTVNMTGGQHLFASI
jgi:predicted transglutaminase-like cysteine proteinase